MEPALRAPSTQTVYTPHLVLWTLGVCKGPLEGRARSIRSTRGLCVALSAVTSKVATVVIVVSAIRGPSNYQHHSVACLRCMTQLPY